MKQPDFNPKDNKDIAPLCSGKIEIAPIAQQVTKIAVAGLSESLLEKRAQETGDSYVPTQKVETYKDTPVSELMRRDTSDGYTVLCGRGKVTPIKIGTGEKNRKALEKLQLPGPKRSKRRK